MSRRSRSAIDVRHLVDVAADLGDPTLGAGPGVAVTYSLSAASGKTTRADVAALDHATAALVRPSPLTGPQLVADAAVRGHALTASVTSRLRIATVASIAVDEHAVLRHSSVHRRASSATAGVVVDRDASRIAANATARYIAPVSRYSRPRRAATARPTVLLPAPAGPSMAMTQHLTRAHQLVPCGMPSL